MNSLKEKYWWRSLPVPHSLENTEKEFFFRGTELSELITAVHEKNADCRFRVRGYSMYPAIRDGDVITLAPVREMRLFPGDIVAYHLPATKKLVIHRLRGFRDGSFFGSGDNTDNPDGWIPTSAILGIVIAVERNGRKLSGYNRNKYPVRTRITNAFRVTITPLSNSLRRKIIRKSQLAICKRFLRPITRFLVRTEFSPIAEVLIVSDDRIGLEGKLLIDLFLMKLHSVRMEFTKEYAQGEGSWWFSGSGTHELLKDLDLEREVFRKAYTKFLKFSKIPLFVDFPVKNQGLFEFLYNNGFVEEERYYPESDCFLNEEGERVIMRYQIAS